MDSENVFPCNESNQLIKSDNVLTPLENKLANIEPSLITESMKQPKKNLVKRLKSRKRPIKILQSKHSRDPRKLKEDMNENCLCVSDWPTHWSEDKIKEFIQKQSISYKSLEILPCKEIEGKKSLLLLFNSVGDAKTAHRTLINTDIEDTSLCICHGDEVLCREYHYNLPTSDSSSDESVSRLSDVEGYTITNPPDIWDEDREGLYGLNRECLRKLGILSPLTNWVHVSNFICDRPTLKELMDMAGSVLVCHIHRAKMVFAKVKYSHPIEAAQAVSMFHSQLFHGKYLNVSIDAGPHTNCHFLPNGITRLGPGFGNMGQPLRDVVNQFERYAAGQRNTLTGYIFGNDKNIKNFEYKTELTMPRDDDQIFQVVNELTAMGAKQYEILDVLQELKKKMSSGNSRSEVIKPERKISMGSDWSEIPMTSTKTEQKMEKKSPSKTDRDGSDAESSGDYSPGKVDSPESSYSRDKRLQYPKKTKDETKSNKYTSMPDRPASNDPGGSSHKYSPMPAAGPVSMGPRPYRPNMPMMAPNIPGMMHNAQSGGMQCGPNMPMMANMSGPNGPTMQFRPVNQTPWGQMMGPPMPQGSGPPMFQGNHGPQMCQGPMQDTPASSSVVMYNIPASITPDVLREKMSLCGRVQYINTQQPGAALIKFSTSWEAFNCVQTFDKTIVNGNTIEAKLFT